MQRITINANHNLESLRQRGKAKKATPTAVTCVQLMGGERSTNGMTSHYEPRGEWDLTP